MIIDSILFALFTVITGLISSAVICNKRMVPSDVLLIGYVSGLFFPVFIFYTLAVLKIYSFSHLLLLWVSIFGGLGAYSYKTGKFRVFKEIFTDYSYRGNRGIIIVHSVVLVSFALYFERPSEWIVSVGSDVANYVIQAAYQTNHSSLFLEDSLYEMYKSYFPNAQYKINSTTAFYPTFAFPPLNKLYIAVLMSFNLKLGFYSPFLLALGAYLSISKLSVFCFKTKLVQILTPFIAISTPIFIFYSTITMSEMLMLTTLLSSLAIAYVAYKTNSKGSAILSGLIFASIFAIRMEALVYFVSWILIGSILFLASKDQVLSTVSKYVLITISIFSIYFWYPCIDSGRWYYERHLNTLFPLLNRLLIINLAMVSFVFVLERFDLVKDTVRKIVTNKFNNQLVSILIVLILLLIVSLRYIVGVEDVADIEFGGELIRRMMKQSDMNALMNYTSPMLLFSGIVGVGAIFLQRKYKLYPIVLLFLVMSTVLLISPRHSDGNYWLIRRYLATIFPLMIFSSSALLEWIMCKSSGKKVLQYFLIILWLGGSAYYLIENNSTQDTHHLRTLVGETDKFVQHTKYFDADNDVVIIDGNTHLSDGYTLALKYVFRIEALNPVISTILDEELLKFVKDNIGSEKTVYMCGLGNEQINRMQTLFTLSSVYAGDFPALKKSTLYKVDLK